MKSALRLAGIPGSVQLVYPQEKAPALELLQVQGNISMLAGAGGNITVQTG